MIASSTKRRSPLLSAWPLLVALLAVAGCRPGDDDAPRIERPPERGSRTLEELPPPPPLQVDPEAVRAGADLEVVVARPQGEAPLDTQVAITFSRPVAALGAPEIPVGAEAPFTIAPAVPGVWRWMGSAAVEFVPTDRLPMATAFTITVHAGLAAIDGSTLVEDHTFTFRTPALQVEKLEPADGFRWLDERPTLQITWNQPVEQLSDHAWLQRADGRRVGLEVTAVEDLLPPEGEGAALPPTTRYTLRSAAPLALDESVTLVVDRGLPAAEGTLPLAQRFVANYRIQGPMRIEGAQACTHPWGCPYGPLVLFTRNPADAASLRERLRIEPEVELDWDRARVATPSRWQDLPGAFVSLPGKFMPGTTYQIRIEAGVQDVEGRAAPAWEGAVSFSDLEPQVIVGSSLALLEAEGDGKLPIQMVNFPRAEVEVWRLEEAQLARALATWKTPDTPPTRRFDLASSAPRNVLGWEPIDVRGSIGRETGLFFVRVQGPHRYRPTAMGQITDLAVHAKFGETSGLAWVTRLSSGASVAGASLRLYDRDGNVVWRGATGDDGLATLPGAVELNLPGHAWSMPFAMLAAEQEGDVGVTTSMWNDGLGAYSFALPSSWSSDGMVGLGEVVAERGIYRPGDTAHLKGLVRLRRLGKVETPREGSVLSLWLEDAQGDRIHEQDVRLTAFGTFSLDVPLPEQMPLGTVWARAKGQVEGHEVVVAGSFRVEEYRAPHFRVDVSLSERAVTAGEAMEGSVLARYLYGAAMADASTRWTLLRRTTHFAPPGAPDYTFGSQVWWWDDDTPGPSAEVVGAGEAQTGPEGGLLLPLGVAETPGDKTWAYVFEAEVTDRDRQRVAGRAELLAHPAAAYVGIRQGTRGFAQVGREVPLDLVAVAPDGARAAGLELALSVRHREWKSIRKKGVGGEWFTITEPTETEVATCARTSGKEEVRCAFTPEQVGMFVLEATLTDREGRRQTTRDALYVVGDGWVSWQRNDTDRIELVPDRDRYQPGDVAKVLIKSPYPEVEALLTIEREGVISHRRLRLEGSAQTVDVPIDASMIPNVFVGVILQRGRVSEGGIEAGDDPGRPAVRVGYTQLQVEDAAKRLQVRVRPDAQQKRPGETLVVDVQVTDADGAGTEAEVALWAVDEGVLRLTGYTLPDPVAMIHPPRGLSVRIGEPLLHLVQRRLYADKGHPSGGGGGDGSGAGIRSNFQTTAFFLPEVRTDAQGRARVEVELPDNLTTYRIMALAVDRGDRMGAGESLVEVAKPLLVLPSLPRLARVGDVFEAGVVVHAAGLELGEVQVRAEVEGVTPVDVLHRSVSVGRGLPVEVRFPLLVESPGEAVFRFFVEGGGERDALQVSLPLHLPVAMEAVALSGETTDQSLEALTLPTDVRDDVGGLEVRFASTALAGFEEGMQQLVDYPYGCLEQEASRLVPFLAVRELMGRFGLPWEEGRAAGPLFGHEDSDPDATITRTIAAIERLQRLDGGYRYWSSNPCSSAGGSAYAVLALSRAKELGYPVDGEALARAQRYLAEQVVGRTRDGCTLLPHDRATQVFALWALARSGAPRASSYPAFYAQREELPLFARVMLADAMRVGGGDRRLARAVLDEVLTHAKETQDALHFEEREGWRYAHLWSSDVRTSALVLQTLVTLSPDHPYVPKLARYLERVRGRDGRYASTQDAAFALMALTEVTRVKETEEPAFTAEVRVDGKPVASARMEGRTLDVVRERIPIDALGDGGSLRFSKEGAGLLYYGATLRVAPRTLPTDPLERGYTVQRWLEPADAPGKRTTRFEAGELVRVRARVATSQERHYTILEIPLPAGLEVVDTSLATTAAPPPDAVEDEEEARSPWAYRFYDPFHHVDRRDDRVVFFSDRLPPGIHTVTVLARATTIGRFVLPPAQAEGMYAPEVFGRSDGGVVEVLADVQTAGR